MTRVAAPPDTSLRPPRMTGPAVVAGLLALGASGAAASEAWSCIFTARCAAGLCAAIEERVEITPLDHEPGLVVLSGLRVAPAQALHPAGSARRSYAALDADRVHLVTVFADGQALDSRHRPAPGNGPVAAETRFGTCRPL